MFIDSEALRLCDPYMPKEQGVLIGNGKINTQIGTGVVIWRTVYARRLYYNPQYSFAQAPLRGGMWFELTGVRMP